MAVPPAATVCHPFGKKIYFLSIQLLSLTSFRLPVLHPALVVHLDRLLDPGSGLLRGGQDPQCPIARHVRHVRLHRGGDIAGRRESGSEQHPQPRDLGGQREQEAAIEDDGRRAEATGQPRHRASPTAESFGSGEQLLQRPHRRGYGN